MSGPDRSYRPLRGLGVWLLGLLGVVLVIDAAMLAAHSALVGMLRRITGGEQVAFADLAASDLRLAWLGGLYLVVSLTALVSFLIWFRRAYENVVALGAPRRRFATGWAVGGWFVPFLNLVRPKQVADEIWLSATSDPHGGADPSAHVSRLPVHVWWALWLASWAISVVVLSRSLVGPPADAVALLDHETTVLVGVGVALCLHVVWLGLIRRITVRQDRRAAQLGLTPVTASPSTWVGVAAPVTAVIVAVGAIAAGAWLTRPAGVAGQAPLDLAVGDCFDDPPPDSEVVVSVRVVPCEGSHDNEVFAVIDLEHPDGAAYPASEEFFNVAHGACTEHFPAYVGGRYEDSPFEVLLFYPMAETWALNDRTVVCFLFDPALAKLEGTAAGVSAASSVVAFATGDCYDAIATEPTTLDDLEPAACTGEHDGEVFAVVDLPGGPAAHPGAHAMAQAGDRACRPEFRRYVGISVEDSTLTITAVGPAPLAWERGDRQVLCTLQLAAGKELVGSMRNQATKVVARERAFIDDLQVGQCFDESTRVMEEYEQVERFACGALHDYEVFALVALPGEVGAPYPSDDELSAEADEGCLEQFSAYVGIDYAESLLDFWFYLPTAESWHGGDRLVICVIEGDGQLRGSVAGRAY